MTSLIDGATAAEVATVPNDAGVLQPISTWTISAAWRAGGGIVPATPTYVSVDANTWLVLASTTGLGGRSCALRVTIEDPVSGRVYIRDAMYLVVA